MNKADRRQRRARRSRAKIRQLEGHRLSVHRTSQHIYAQIIAVREAKVVVSASTLEAVLRSQLGHGGNVAAAAEIGKTVAQRAVKVGVTKVSFDRSGFKYHGRVKALADAAREHGLKF